MLLCLLPKVKYKYEFLMDLFTELKMKKSRGKLMNFWVKSIKNNRKSCLLIFNFQFFTILFYKFFIFSSRILVKKTIFSLNITPGQLFQGVGLFFPKLLYLFFSFKNNSMIFLINNSMIFLIH